MHDDAVPFMTQRPSWKIRGMLGLFGSALIGLLGLLGLPIQAPWSLGVSVALGLVALGLDGIHPPSVQTIGWILGVVLVSSLTSMRLEFPHRIMTHRRHIAPRPGRYDHPFVDGKLGSKLQGKMFAGCNKPRMQI